LVAHQELGARALAAIADSPSLPRRELDEALEVARNFGFPVRVVHTNEFANTNYLQNPVDRCYFCKHELFTELQPLARSEGFKVIAYGEKCERRGRSSSRRDCGGRVSCSRSIKRGWAVKTGNPGILRRAGLANCR
jgi:uncharacterized protein